MFVKEISLHRIEVVKAIKEEHPEWGLRETFEKYEAEQDKWDAWYEKKQAESRLLVEYTDREKICIEILMSKIRCKEIASSTTNKEVFDIVRNEYNKMIENEQS